MKIIISSFLRGILVLMLTILGLGTSQEAAAQTITHHWKMGDDDSAALLGGLMETTDDSVGTLHLSGRYPQFGSNPPSYTAVTSASANAPFSARFRPSNNAGLSSAVDTSLVSSASFFMEFWIRPESASWPDDYPIVRHGNAVTSGFGFVTSSAISPYGGSTIMVAFKAPGVSQLFPLPVGEWTHVAVVHDGGQFQVWVNDGIFHGPAASSFTAYDPGSRLFIGALDGVSAFNYIDEVRIGTFTPGTFDLNMLNFPANKIGVDPGPVEFVTLSGSQGRVISSGLLAANRDNSTTSYSGVLSGPGHFQKAGNGVLTLMAASSYGGITNAWQGTLALGVHEALPDTSRLLIGKDAVFDLAGYSETVGALDGWGNVMLGTGTLAVGENGASAVFRGSISGTGGLVKAGSGTLTLAGTNNYTGITTVNAGTLVLDADSTTSGVILNGGTLDLGGVSRTMTSLVQNGGNILNGTITAGSVSVTSGTLTAGGAVIIPVSGSLQVGAGAVYDSGGGGVALGSLTGTGIVAMGAGSLTLGEGHSSSVFAGNISGSGEVNKTGTGTLTLSGVNTYTGFTHVLGGSLTVASGGIVDTPGTDIVVASTGTGSFVMDGGAVTARAVIIGHDGGTATVTLRGGTLTTGEIARWSVPSSIAFDGGTLCAAGNTTVLLNGFTAGSAVIQSGGLVLNTNGFTVSTPAELTGSGSLTKIGAGTLTLSGNFSHTGDTIVHAGTLALSSARLSDSAGVVIASGATLNLIHNSLDTVSALIIDGVPQVFGTWGAIGSGAQHETARITGPGRLLILSPSAFAAWTSMFGLTGPNALHSADPDADGALNLLEFYSGSSPVSAGPVAPTLLKTPTGLDFTYSRAKGVTGVTAIVEWTDDLLSWSISGVSEPTVVTDQGATEIVKVTVPAGSGTGRFVRLRVTSP